MLKTQTVTTIETAVLPEWAQGHKLSEGRNLIPAEFYHPSPHSSSYCQLSILAADEGPCHQLTNRGQSAPALSHGGRGAAPTYIHVADV